MTGSFRFMQFVFKSCRLQFLAFLLLMVPKEFWFCYFFVIREPFLSGCASNCLASLLSWLDFLSEVPLRYRSQLRSYFRLNASFQTDVTMGPQQKQPFSSNFVLTNGPKEDFINESKIQCKTSDELFIIAQECLSELNNQQTSAPRNSAIRCIRQAS